MQDTKYRQKFAIGAPSHNFALSAYIFATKARIDNRKNLLNSNVSPTCPNNMVNFGPLAAEIRWRVWGTTANFKGFRLLAALLHDTLVVGVTQTLRRHLYSAGRPSRWALAHNSSSLQELWLLENANRKPNGGTRTHQSALL